MFSTQGISPSLMVFPRTDGKIQTVREACMVHSWFITHIKKLEDVDFVDAEFLHKKININGVYMWIMVCYGRYSRRCM